jgi:hypothetical protein
MNGVEVAEKAVRYTKPTVKRPNLGTKVPIKGLLMREILLRQSITRCLPKRSSEYWACYMAGPKLVFCE